MHDDVNSPDAGLVATSAAPGEFWPEVGGVFSPDVAAGPGAGVMGALAGGRRGAAARGEGGPEVGGVFSPDVAAGPGAEFMVALAGEGWVPEALVEEVVFS